MRSRSWARRARRNRRRAAPAPCGSLASKSCAWPDPAILAFTAEVKWAAGFFRLAAQAVSKDESLDYRRYTGKIRDMLEAHVHATGLSTTIRLRSITDPQFGQDFRLEGKTEAELQEAFIRKSAELRPVTRELVDKNPAQYGRFSERVMEIIRRFDAGQLVGAAGPAGPPCHGS